MKVYISGQISGVKDYQKNFAVASQELIRRGHIPVNPANVVHEGWSYKQYIDHDLILLSICDAIYMLKGWEESRGASLELNYAMTTGMQVIFEEDVKRGCLL